ncbi:MAG: lipoyl(octanoyl) transferase LipB, partial [Bacteroidales bacterium]
MNINNKVFFKDLGLTDYKEAWRFQESLFNSTVKKKLEIRNAEEKSSLQTPNYLLFCEHPHVFTLGKNGSANNLLINEASLKLKNASFVKIDRGGDITYHGPGQIVGYPVLDLENFTPSIRQYVYNLEEAVIRTIEKYGIKGERLEGASGVWLDKGMPGKTRKI